MELVVKRNSQRCYGKVITRKKRHPRPGVRMVNIRTMAVVYISLNQGVSPYTPVAILNQAVFIWVRIRYHPDFHLHKCNAQYVGSLRWKLMVLDKHVGMWM